MDQPMCVPDNKLSIFLSDTRETFSELSLISLRGSKPQLKRIAFEATKKVDILLSFNKTAST